MHRELKAECQVAKQNEWPSLSAAYDISTPYVNLKERK